MDFAPEDLPTDYNQLLVLTRLLIAELKDTRTLILVLRNQIAKLERIAFGRRSEKVTLELAQLRLLLGDMEGPSLRDEQDGHPAAPIVADSDDSAGDDSNTGVKRPATPRPRKPFPADAPCETIMHPVCACPDCGGTRLHKVGEDRRKVMERIPATVKIIE